MTRSKASTPNIYERPNGKYQVKVTLTVGGQKQVLKQTFPTYEEAATYLEQKRAQATLGQLTVSSRTPLGDFLDQWWLRHQRHMAGGADDVYARHLRLYLKPQLGATALADLSSDKISDALWNLYQHGGANGRPLRHATVTKSRAILHAALSDAVRRRLIPANPVDDAELPKRPKAQAPKVEGTQKAWTEAQLFDLFLPWAAENDPDHYDMWIAYALTGARRHEVLGVTWADVDFAKRKLHLRHTKGDHPRTIDLPAALASYLKKVKLSRPPALTRPDSLVFFGSDGNAIPPLHVTKWFDKAVARARRDLGPDKLPRITLHGVRHTVGTLLHDWGYPPAAAARMLGHTVQVYLSVYVHDVDHGEELADALSARLAGRRVPMSTQTQTSTL